MAGASDVAEASTPAIFAAALGPLPVRSRFAVVPVAMIVAVAVLFTALGGLYRFGPATALVWALLSLVAALWFLRRPGLLWQMFVAHWPVTVLPLLALLSTVWSVAPGATLNEAVKMAFTVIICFYLAAQLDTRQLVLALGLSMGVAVALSVLNLVTGFLPPVWETNGALLGIFTQKTILAKAVVWAAFACIAAAAYRGLGMIGVLAAIAMFPITTLAQSITGKIGYLFVAMLVVLLMLRRTGPRLRLAGSLVIGLGLAGLLVGYFATGGEVLPDLLAVAGKDTTLTGRTVIWAIGIDAWRDAPVLGLGYDGFWNSPAYALKRNYIEAYVDDGLHGFHNVYVEIAVALGLVGLCYFVGLVLVTLVRLTRDVLLRPSIDAAVWLSALTMIVALGMIEASFLAARSGHLMLFVLCVIRSQAAARPGD
jgi:O-antigen ligase